MKIFTHALAIGLLVPLLACDGGKDTSEETGIVGDVDADEDGFLESVDCDDDDPEVNPAAIELCDGIDNDCDGSVDETCAPQVKNHMLGDGFSLSSDNGQHFVHHTVGAPRLMRTSTNGIFTVTPGLLKGAIQ